jgi:hypothetical protein
MPDLADLGTRRNALQALAVLAAASALAPLAAAQEEIPGAPDFSAVTTKRAAQQLVREGRLVRISLFPTELGGSDDPMNTSFITPEAAEVRELVIGTLRRLLEQDAIDRLNVQPDYKGDSIVPSRITMSATHSGQDGSINTAIEVW